MTDTKLILYKQDGPVGRISLNRPENSNALTAEMLTELRTLIKKLDWQEDVRVLIISGAGRGFSAGYDIDFVAQREDFTVGHDILRNREVLDIYRDIRNSSVITIGQIHGFCLNGGLDLCQQFDYNIVADDAVIGCPVDRRVGATVAQMWLYHVGPQWAKYMLMTGDTIDGKMAERIGLAIKSVPESKLEKTTDFFADRLSQVNKVLLSTYKSIVNKALDLQGCSQMQEISAEIISVANHAEEVNKNFRRLTMLGIQRLKKDVNEGYKPQRAPFEPVDE